MEENTFFDRFIHFSDFFTMPAFANLHSGGSSSSSYRSSHTSSSQARPSSSSSYFQSGQTAQAGQIDDMLPLVRPASGYSSFSKYEEHKVSGAEPALLSPAASSYTSDTYIRNPVLTPASSSYSSSSDTSYIRSPVIKPVLTSETSSFSTSDISNNRASGHRPYNTEREELEDTHQVPVAPSYSSVQTKYHRKETVKSTGPVVNTYPSGGASSKVTETYEYKAPPKTVVSLPLANDQRGTPPPPLVRQRYYNGDIFRSSVRPTTPQSCAAADYSYKSPSQVDIVALERSVQEVQCLAVLAETTMKAEIYALKEANTNLVSRLQDLDQQFHRFRSECKCGY